MSTSTINARPITYAEIEALAAGDAPESFEGYVAEESARHGLTLTPTTFTVRRRKHAAPIYQAVPDDRPNVADGTWVANKDRVVGHRVSLDTRSMFGSESGVDLFSSPEAEDSAVRLGWSLRAVERGKEVVYLADDNADEFTLTPVYGAQLTVSLIVKGVTAEDVQARAETALRAEFGDALNDLMKVRARPVEDERIDVYTIAPRKLVAANILAAEASFVAPGSVYETTETDPDFVVGR